MIKVLTMAALLLFLAAGCAGGGSAESSTGDPGASPETTGANPSTGETSPTPETTVNTVEGATGPSQTGDVRLKQISSSAMGPEKRQILIAASAQALAAATGLEVPDAGKGTYVAAAWGEKPTGGYTVDFGTASVEGVRVITNIELKQPPPEAMVAQALTYPYAVAFLPGIDPGEKTFTFVTRNGSEIGWPVRSA